MPEAGETYTITEGGNITCTAIGYPEPDVEWMNDDRSISDQNTVVTKNLIKSTGHLFNVSVSMTVSRNDAGNYTCIANNPFGNDISIITVVVLCKLTAENRIAFIHFYSCANHYYARQQKAILCH